MKKRMTGLAGLGLAIVLLTSCMGAEEKSAFDAINADRAAVRVAALTEHALLVAKAQDWAAQLLNGSNNGCSTTTLHHSTLQDKAPANWLKLGENVGCIFTDNDPANAVKPLEDAFMKSEGHRDNIQDPAFNAAGVGIAWKKLPNGRYLVYEAQEFAKLQA